MASFDLYSILGAPQLVAAIMARLSGLPRPFPAAFYKSRPEDGVEKNTGSFYRRYGQRQTARVSGYGTPSKAVQQQQTEAVPVILASSSENIFLALDELQGLINWDSTGIKLSIDEKGAEQIKWQVGEFYTRFENLRTAFIATCLATDQVSFDAGGNLLPPNSTTTPLFTVSSGVPAGNQGQLNALGTGNIIDKTWDDPTAQIDRQLRDLQLAAAKLTGYKLKYAFYGANVPSFLYANNLLKPLFQFAQSGSVAAQFLLKNEVIPDGFCGMQWIYAGDSFFQDQNGVNQQIVGDSEVIFTPDPDEYGWYKLMEGTKLVPTNIGAVPTSGLDALVNTMKQRGRFAYANVELDPVAIKVIAGDTFVPVLSAPQAIFQAEVSSQS